LSPVLELTGVTHGSNRGRCGEGPDANERHHALRVAVGFRMNSNLCVEPSDFLVQRLPVF
jgi:hypothetical protein